MIETQQELKDLDFLRRTPEYQQWAREWREKLRSYEQVASDYLGRRAYKDA